MSKYLKKILFSLVILMMPYMNSASNAVFGDLDDQSGHIVAKQSTSPSNMSWEDWKPAMNAVSSSVKALAQVPFDAVNYALDNPIKTAAVLTAVYLFPGAAAEAAEIAGTCACFCWQGRNSLFIGCADNKAGCESACKGLQMDRCVPNNMGCK